MPINAAPVPVFLNLIGRTMFEGQWKTAENLETSAYQELFSVPFENHAQFMTQLAFQHLIDALQTGTVKVILGPLSGDQSKSLVAKIEQWDWQQQQKFHKAELRRAKAKGVVLEKLYENEDDRIARADGYFLGLVSYTPHKHFKPSGFRRPISLTIDKDFWRLPEAKVVLANTHHEFQDIPFSHLFLARGIDSPFSEDVFLGDVPIGAKSYKGQLVVRNVDRALKTITNWPGADDISGWGEAYRHYNRKFWPEIVAVAWRIIAINGWAADHIKISDLSNAIRDYLNTQDTLPKHLQVSDESVLSLASKVVKQFKTGSRALREPVLVNPKRT